MPPPSASIYLTISPIPRSLSESRLVLAALQKFGEVAVFRSLKYDTSNTTTSPRGTIATFTSQPAAAAALAASPITIPLPAHSSSPSPSTSSTSQSPPSPDNHTNHKLTCFILPSRHNHTNAMHRNPFYGSFEVERGTPRRADLVKTGIPMKQLVGGTRTWMPGGVEGSLMELFREGIRNEGREGIRNEGGEGIRRREEEEEEEGGK